MAALTGSLGPISATDNANHTTTELTPALKVGNDPEPCRDFTDNNFNHVQRGRAVQCNFGFTCATGSGDNLGLFGLGITSMVKETGTNPGVFKERSLSHAMKAFYSRAT